MWQAFNSYLIGYGVTISVAAIGMGYFADYCRRELRKARRDLRQSAWELTVSLAHQQTLENLLKRRRAREEHVPQPRDAAGRFTHLTVVK